MYRQIIILVLLSFSLQISVTAATLGIRSLYRADKFEYVSAGGRLVLLISKNGRLDVLYLANWRGEAGFTHIRGSPSGYGGTDYSRRFLGFGAGVQLNGGRFINVPWWFLALIFALPTLLTIPLARRYLGTRRRGFAPITTETK